MKTAAIIAEYNPFHNGHLYQIKKLREITDTDYVISIMSGNYLQRGIPAMTEKYSRGLMAVSSGIDLVLELPLPYACGSAGDFAEGAVRMLNLLGNIDYLCFGAECDDLNLLSRLAEVIVSEQAEYKEVLRKNMRSGLPYPVSRAEAVAACLKDYSGDMIRNVSASPNNILAIEYLCALIKTKSPIKPIIIKRIACDYNDDTIPDNNTMPGHICSANSIRKTLESKNPGDFSDDFKLMKDVMPSASFDIIFDAYQKSALLFPNDLMNALRLKLTDYDISDGIYDIDDNLKNRIMRTDSRCSMDEYISKIKTKNYTYTRISRALLRIILRITQEEMNKYKDNGWIYYGNILGFRLESSKIIKILSGSSQIPLINKKSTWKKISSAAGMTMLQTELRASEIYNNLVYEKSGVRLKNELTVTTPFV